MKRSNSATTGQSQAFEKRNEVFRRTFLAGLGGAGYGLGQMALSQLLGGGAQAATATGPKEAKWTGTLKAPHHAPRARRVIFLTMAGAPSQFESFDWKPALRKLHGQPFPESFTKGQQLAQLQNTQLIAQGPMFDFKKWGKSGQEISTMLPHIGSIADDICIVRSMHTEQINHDPAHAFMNAGTILKGRPAWARGSRTALAPKPTTCRPSSRWFQSAFPESNQSRRDSGRRDSYRDNIKAAYSNPRATPFTTQGCPTAWTWTISAA